MALRLQLENGVTREYRTWYSIGESPCEGCYNFKYETKYGLHWNQRPAESCGCGHLNCAIDASNHSLTSSKEMSWLCIIGGILLFALRIVYREGPIGVGLLIGVGCIFTGANMRLNWYADSEINRDLIEFQNQGTVNGIKAYKIGDHS